MLCACVDDKWLYYSSLNDLHALQLTTASSSSEETGIESQLQALTSDSLGVCRVIALAGPYTNSTGTVHELKKNLCCLPGFSSVLRHLPQSVCFYILRICAAFGSIFEWKTALCELSSRI